MKIVVLGIGGAGGNMIEILSKKKSRNVLLYKINTDYQALLHTSKNIKTIQLGDGLGAGMRTEVGLAAAKTSTLEIEKIIQPADILFLVSGMGGGTGTGASPYIAEIAKKMNKLTIGIITKPFIFEGKKRLNIALDGIASLNKNIDALMTIENNKLLSIIDKKIGIKESFKFVDGILSSAIHGLINILMSNNNNDINLDFADVKTIFSHQGDCLILTGESKNSIQEAIDCALNSPLLLNLNYTLSKGAIIHFEINPNYPFLDLSESMSNLQASFTNKDVEIIFGTTTNNKLNINESKVSIILTGLSQIEQKRVFKISA